jgi:hypothetical protein
MSGSGSGNNITVNMTALDSGFLNISANWTQFYNQSLIDGSSSNWTAAQWKEWINFYGSYLEALSLYENATVTNITDSVL